MKEGGAKCSRYFAFVKKILELKKIKRAGQREESNEQGGVNVEPAQDLLAQVNISRLHCIGSPSSSLLSHDALSQFDLWKGVQQILPH